MQIREFKHLSSYCSTSLGNGDRPHFHARFPKLHYYYVDMWSVPTYSFSHFSFSFRFCHCCYSH
uniref:Uncharacterized protein n=1 Tax=Anguilla anguilla TaxID=7936 RepID=A0A0E9T877_ANGAN